MATKKSSDKGVQQCPVGTVLFHEGDVGDKMYVIKAGRVLITKKVFGTSITLEELKAGDFCGEISLLNDDKRPSTAVVTREASVIPISAQQFENMVKSNSDIATRMLKRLSERLTQSHFRMTNFALRKTKARLMHQLRAQAADVDASLTKPTPIPDDLASVLDITVGEMKGLLGELVRDGAIEIDARGSFTINDLVNFDQNLSYLELKDRFEYRD